MSHPWSAYPTLSRSQLLARLTDLSSELAETHTELAYTKAEEFKNKVGAWASPREESVSGRINDVYYCSATETISAIELEGRVKAQMEEKFLILKLLEHT